MSKFDKSHLVAIFSKLGDQLRAPNELLQSAIQSEHFYNAWFTPQSTEKAVKAIGHMLNTADLEKWFDSYDFKPDAGPKKIGLVLAGNIPLVGFHDVLCVLASGNFAMIKASGQDARLVTTVLNMLIEIEPEFANHFAFVDRLKDFDAVIATGSNNTSRYFDYYFSKVPNIIRKNRNSIGVISGFESTAELHELGHDIFDYFGLGCRNVSKLLVPEDYDFTMFFESIESYLPVIHHHKYNNNYDYNKSIYLVNREHHLDNGFLLLKEDAALASPLAVLYYQHYTDVDDAIEQLKARQENIQCIVSAMELDGAGNQVVGFGQSQGPKLWDYADGVDTMKFLVSI